jgi:hypothetical protein
VEVALPAGRQDDEHSATGVARVDLQLRDLDVRLEGRIAIAQPAKVCHSTVTSLCQETELNRGLNGTKDHRKKHLVG